MTNLVFILIGLFSILGGVLNQNWFMNNASARFFVNIFGRNSARIFYIGLGILVVAYGLQ